MEKVFNVNEKLAYPKRQVHLDFHTSPKIPVIAKRFSRENFKAALTKGHLESITVFAKCHHSYCYYPTKVGTVHPGLDFDLTGEMISAAHEVGVRAPVYITAGWSEYDAETHPEWTAKDKDGKTIGMNYYDNTDPDMKRPEVCWAHMCLNDGSYAHHIYDLTEEVCQRYENLDGLFYDICVSYPVCYCEECRAGMAKEGFNPENEDDAKKYFQEKHHVFMNTCGEILHKYHKNATIFFNAGGAEINMPQFHQYQTHFEMEDLPTAWGGYSQMAPRARFFDKKNKFYLGMTGKFHLAWGEFGGFKSKDALKYEVCCMAQYGAGCSIGDHLCPDGEMDMQTYENIGYAYSYLEKIAPYCYGGKYVTNIGVYFQKKNLDFDGTVDILLENQIDFDYVVDGNFEKFDTVIFTDEAMPTDDELAKLKAYVENGGKVLFTGNALQNENGFAIDCGLKYVAGADRDQDYIRARISESDNLPKSPFLAYTPINKYENIDAEIFAEALIPIFSRTNAHFCGHKNAPYDKDAVPTPALARKGNVVFMAHKAGQMYKEYGCVAHRDYFISALKNLCGYKSLTTVNLGSCGRVTVIDQNNESRYCVNLTYAAPQKRGVAEIIDDILPLYNIPFALKTDKKVTRVYSPVTNEKIKFKQKDGVVSFVIPKIECHNTVVIEYK